VSHISKYWVVSTPGAQNPDVSGSFQRRGLVAAAEGHTRHGRGDGDAHAAVLRGHAHRRRPAVIDYFRQVAEAIDIPIMVQDAPLSPTPLPAGLLIDLVRQVPE
jgi:hypothetical protein